MFCLKKSDVLRFPDGVFPSCTTATAYFASIGFYKIFFATHCIFRTLFYIRNFHSLSFCNSHPVAQAGMHMGFATRKHTHMHTHACASKHARKLRTRIVRANRASTLCTQIVSANPARVSKDTEGYSCGLHMPQHRNTT